MWQLVLALVAILPISIFLLGRRNRAMKRGALIDGVRIRFESIDHEVVAIYYEDSSGLRQFMGICGREKRRFCVGLTFSDEPDLNMIVDRISKALTFWKVPHKFDLKESALVLTDEERADRLEKYRNKMRAAGYEVEYDLEAGTVSEKFIGNAIADRPSPLEALSLMTAVRGTVPRYRTLVDRREL